VRIVVGGRGILGRMSSPDPRRRPDLMDSIVTNVTSILNTHEGDGYTCPKMGCDFVGLMSRWPTSESDVMATLRRTVEEYEPRLRNVNVRRVVSESHVISIEITGELKDGSNSRERVRLQTQLAVDGRFEVG
jgi:type VI secretion system lysozyme-like protein